MTQTLRDLIAWQPGKALARDVYQITRRFPDEERFGLVMQLRRAVVSIPSNIAEGRGRGTKKDFAHFLMQAADLYMKWKLRSNLQRNCVTSMRSMQRAC